MQIGCGNENCQHVTVLYIVWIPAYAVQRTGKAKADLGAVFELLGGFCGEFSFFLILWLTLHGM